MRLVSSFAVFLAACGANGQGDLPSSDASPSRPETDGSTGDGDDSPDAGMAEPDAARTECPPGLPASFGDLGLVETTKNDIGGHYNVFARLNGNQRWFFAMNLHPDRGILAEDGLIGVHSLEGDEVDLQYCAACIDLFADLDSVEGGPSLHMFPLKGTLTIDSVDGVEVSGSLDDLLLGAVEVVYDDQGVACTPREDGEVGNLPECVNTICLNNHCGRQVRLAGCETSISHMEF